MLTLVPYAHKESSHSLDSRSGAQSVLESVDPARRPRRGARSCESSEKRLGDRQESGDDANREPENRGEDAQEQREFLPPQVHEQEEQECEEPGSRAEEDNDPTEADAVLPDQIAAEHYR